MPHTTKQKHKKKKVKAWAVYGIRSKRILGWSVNLEVHLTKKLANESAKGYYGDNKLIIPVEITYLAPHK